MRRNIVSMRVYEFTLEWLQSSFFRVSFMRPVFPQPTTSGQSYLATRDCSSSMRRRKRSDENKNELAKKIHSTPFNRIPATKKLSK